VIAAAFSGKTHGQAGSLQINWPPGPPSADVECRGGGPTTVVLTFSKAVVTVDGTPDGSEVSLSAGTLGAVHLDLAGQRLDVHLRDAAQSGQHGGIVCSGTKSSGNQKQRVD
jgi:hypothetical protein